MLENQKLKEERIFKSNEWLKRNDVERREKTTENTKNS